MTQENNHYTIEDLRQIMNRLRSPEGCPWDREQTHRSIIPSLIEEAYEVIEAIEAENPSLLADELGDLLLQVVFHAQIAAENNQFSIDDVIAAICNKLIRRHPHVFGDVQAETVTDVLKNWDAIKKAEKLNENRQSLLDGIPAHLPALLKAAKVQSKTARVGFEWDDISGALTKLDEEIQELKTSISSGDQQAMAEELGDVLFSLVNISRYLNINAELALNNTIAKFKDRFQYIERAAQAQGKTLNEMNLDEMDALWDKAKNHLRKNPQ